MHTSKCLGCNLDFHSPLVVKIGPSSLQASLWETSSLNLVRQFLISCNGAQGRWVTWKSNYFLTIIQLLDEYPKCFTVGAGNVGSKQMQQIPMSLCRKAVVLMGKNTDTQAIWRHLENNPALEKLSSHLWGNVAFVFSKEDLTEIRDMMLADKVPAMAVLVP